MKPLCTLAGVLGALSCAPSSSEALQEPVGPARWHEYPETDALSYEIELFLDPSAGRLRGSVAYRFRALAPLTEVRLDSVPGEDWRVRFFQEQELAAEWTGDRVVVRLEKEIPAGEELTFRAELEGLPPDGLYFGKTRYGEPCAFTDHFSVRARGWLPSEDHPGDRAHFGLRLTVPEELEVVFTGDMQRLSAEGLWEGRTKTEIPTYLLAIAVAPYARLAEAGDERLIPHFVYAQDVERARPALQYHAAWIRLMERNVGPYPYAKYCVVQVPTRWGGMEHAGNTWIAESLFEQNRRGVGTLAHELAHQWFGDGVGYADWFEVWLSEGFASYFGPWLDSQTGGPPLERSMERAREGWRASAVGETLPVRWDGYPNPDNALNSNTYPKGAWILHMLRKELGDEAFFAGIRKYYSERFGKGARTEHLIAAMQSASGRDLAPFFAQWLDRPGCPELRFEWSAEGVLVEQLQDGEPFDFLLPLRWTDAKGGRRDQDFRITERKTRLVLEGAPIEAPVVDPRVELLYR